MNTKICQICGKSGCEYEEEEICDSCYQSAFGSYEKDKHTTQVNEILDILPTNDGFLSWGNVGLLRAKIIKYLEN